MRITRICYFGSTLPLAMGEYVMSRGRNLAALEATVVEVQAEDGTVGYGEACTLGSNYLEGFAGSVRATLHELGPHLIGCDIIGPGAVVDRMDRVVEGHLPAKAAIDEACLDLRGKILGLPAYQLLGGRLMADYPVFHPISLSSPAHMVEEAKEMSGRGYRSWQLKLGDDPVLDAGRVHAVLDAVGDSAEFVTSDANGGWSLGQAARFLSAIEDVDTYVEQPCRSMEEVAQLRERSGKPFVVDEVIRTLHDLLRCIATKAGDAVNLKSTRVGGLTKAAQFRDVAQAAGMMLIVDEPMGGALAMAGAGHLAVTCRPDQLLAASMPATTHVAESARTGMQGGPAFRDGRGLVPDAPGLGVEVDIAALGEPVQCADNRGIGAPSRTPAQRG